MKPLVVQAPAFLLDFLLANVQGLNRTKIKQTLKFGSVQVNGEVITYHHHALKTGDKITFLGKREAAAERSRQERELDIVYEDAEVLVVNKPAGLLTMASDTEKERTLYFQLTDYERSKNKDGKGRVFIVHRLDRDTSGLVLFAKNPRAKVFLQKEWPQVEKRYQAVVEGVPVQKSGRIRSALAEDKFKRVYRSKDEGAKDSVTNYRVIGSNGRYSLVELSLETGRKNQIRVHLADMGHPIVGDEKYGATSNPMGRLALHACYLTFPHPAAHRTVRLESKAPESFRKWTSPGRGEV